MALRMWASSTANALRLSTSASKSPSFSLSRAFSTVLEDLKYASSHEWVKHDGSVATIGITDHAQNVLKRKPREANYIQGHLGEVVFVELPDAGKEVKQGSGLGAVESVKATSNINSPISGEVIEVNTKLTDSPGLINTSPYEEGWMIKVKPSNASELGSLMGSKEH